MTHFWLRSEDREDEFRTPITPYGAKTLIDNGAKVTVEENSSRVFSTQEFEILGCEIAEKGSWIESDPSNVILGLKEINFYLPLCHRHIFFAHAFKRQENSESILNSFKKGKGILYDLEALVDDTGRRLTAFGRYAGFAGAAVALYLWFFQRKGSFTSELHIPLGLSKEQLVNELLDRLNSEVTCKEDHPIVLIIGSKGRVGNGAIELFKQVGIHPEEWDLGETLGKTNFDEILDFDIFINCVLSKSKSIKFIKRESLQKSSKLSVISDVSCDPNSDFNSIPVYTEQNSFLKPYHVIDKNGSPLLLSAIDNLPSMLPRESSEDFEGQLLPYLLDFELDKNNVWLRARKEFESHKTRIFG